MSRAFYEEQLAEALQGLTELPVFVEREDYAALVGSILEAENALRVEDFDVAAVMESGAEPRIKRGEVWRLGRHLLMCGDATDSRDVEKLLGAERPLLMVTDPPYGVGLDRSWRQRASGRPDPRVSGIEGDENADWEAAWRLWPAQVAYVWHASQHAHVVRRGLVNAGYEVR